ncbi:unnamed protein product, partial [Musa textilis]
VGRSGGGKSEARVAMEASQPFSDSDATSSSLCHPGAVAATAAGQTVAAAEVAALSRLSEQLGSLLRSPGLSFCSDARITVRSSGGEPPRVVPVHRCLLAARSPFFRDKFAGGAAALELGEMVDGFEVGCEALEAVLQYIYTGRLEELPRGVAECVDEGCCRHEACWPAVHFMLQVLHAASTFEINELVSLFQRQLLSILQKVATDDILTILLVANLNNNLCQRLLTKCIGMVAQSDIDYVALKKKLPPDIVEQIMQSRSNFGLDGQESLEFPDKHVKSIYGALDSDDIELVKLLLGEGGTTLDNAKALHYAVAYCDSKITKELLSLGLADVNGRDHRHYTVLHSAAMRKEPEIIMSLLTMGARPFDHTSDGRTALQISKRLTRSTDYYRSTEQGKPSPRERLCIEMLEQAEMRDSFTEVTSVPVEMINDNLQERLLYLESRVWLAESLFPTEAKAAMNNANVDGTLKFKSSCLTHLISGNKRSAEDVVKASFKMTEEDFSRMEALTKTEIMRQASSSLLSSFQNNLLFPFNQKCCKSWLPEEKGSTSMGLSFSVLLWNWFAAAGSISLGEKEAHRILRSLSFGRSNSSNRMVSGACDDAETERSLSFRNWEPATPKLDASVPIGEQAADDDVTLQPSCLKVPVNFAVPHVKLPQQLVELSSPRPSSELDAAATKLQKVYKSYRTRRNLADCAVVVEELWWKAVDFASLKHSSILFFDVEKPEPAVSKWARAKRRAARVGKGLSKDEKAQKLALQHWLEAIDPRHRYGHNLHLYYDVWSGSESTQPFFFWLDVGDGREVNLERCPRSKLQKQCISYLGPREREAYEVIVQNGKLVYRQSEMPVNTTEGCKWIFVLSTSRALYVGQKNKGTFQHSSFLAGGATTAAGRLVAKEGIIQAIWPYSGHYLPTEDNFREFISFLGDNHVDLTSVQKCSVDDDEFPAHKKDDDVEVADEAAAAAVEEKAKREDEIQNEEPKEQSDASREKAAMAFDLGRRLSCRWTTGAGARIGCVRDYPADLQSKALEQVNLSPRVVASPAANKVPVPVPIPSPRPSPRLRLSPRLQYMGIPTPRTVLLTLPKP